MPECKKCHKKGLFCKIEGDSGLCLCCNEEFAGKGKELTQKITEAKNKVAEAKDTEEKANAARAIEKYGNELVALHDEYNLQPSQELLDLIETYKKMA